MFPRLSRLHAVAALGAGAAAKVSIVSAPTLAMQPGDWVPLVTEKVFFNYRCQCPQKLPNQEIKQKVILPNGFR